MCGEERSRDEEVQAPTTIANEVVIATTTIEQSTTKQVQVKPRQIPKHHKKVYCAYMNNEIGNKY